MDRNRKPTECNRSDRIGMEETMNEEIQVLLQSYDRDIRRILEGNTRLDYLYALSDQRELLLEWYDFDPKAALLQVGADYGAMTGLFQF